MEIFIAGEGASPEREKIASSTVGLEPDGTRILAEEGYTLLDTLLEAGVALPHECGGNCACTTCRVYVEAGMELLSPMEEAERDRLILENVYQPHVRLACQALIRSPNHSFSSHLRIKRPSPAD
ncbi:MAG TPA: 2Fe-2S iron-sulfur cluster-binding protein [Chthonomonas sp.]|uniref:2Fe-2S iron-sulfur cluster-binding protein n=1 Tax=Chthonomonas sp. TaxID=2282153 RepID=UPI002B4AEB32|nr:2Fe-2S iron-sulfur cluster-binding protein [Chthonomonas sp.]HLI49038.1 2Fe-2S iron-sulfur cluster-binding protein [Chthonomonas sp.]